MRATILFSLTAILVGSGCAHSNKNAKRGIGIASADSDGSATGYGDKKDPCAARVHFDFDSTVIADRDRPSLDSSAQCLKDNRGLRATIEGNADERGTEEYNLALGDKRAVSVAKYLKALGAEEEQIKTVSYGEENPVCKEHAEDCWSANRRAAVQPRNAAAVETKENK
jgi:peptidoglycan-associated lipoprotein